MREEKRSEIIHDALDYLDDEMIEEVDALRGGTQTEKKPFRFAWAKWSAMAAGLCVLVVLGGLWNDGAFDLSSGEKEAHNQESSPLDENTDISKENDEDALVTIPAYQVNLGKSDDYAESDMALFFIYEGRCYVQTCDYMSKDVIGKYVCTTTGLIDEWTKEDGYVELAGSIEADIYTVAGVDPEFMLCTAYDDGVVETFVHNNGISLSRGAEILEWLGFDAGMEEYTSFCNKGNSCTTEVSEEAKEILDKFFANFAENEVVLRKDISATTNEEDIYHLVIVTQDDVPLHFELLNGGYVSYYGLNNVCVKVDERVYNLLIDVLENR